MVDDPSAVPEEFPTDESYEHERLRLFALISELVNWENTTTAATITKTPHHLHRLGDVGLGEVGLGDGRAPGRQVSG
jgi:putative DNA methylase